MLLKISRRDPDLKDFRTALVKALAREQVLATQAAKCDKSMMGRDPSIVAIKVSECGGWVAGGFFDGSDRNSLEVNTSGVSEIEITRCNSPFHVTAVISSKDSALLGVDSSTVRAVATSISSSFMQVILRFYDRTHKDYSESDCGNKAGPFQLIFSEYNPGVQEFMEASQVCRTTILGEMLNQGFSLRGASAVERLKCLSLGDLVCVAEFVNSIRDREKRDVPIIIPQAIIRAAHRLELN